MDQTLVKQYFIENSDAWIKDGYESDGYNFPVGEARMRIVLSLMRSHCGAGDLLVDLGCGGGQLCVHLAREGYQATGVDQSPAMIAAFQKDLEKESQEVRARVKCVQSGLLDNSLPPSRYGAVTAMGVIGYLPEDDPIFQEAYRILRPGGVFVVSCRNRLFNMVSIGSYTIREIENGGAKKLVEEIQELYEPILQDAAKKLVTSLGRAAQDLSKRAITDAKEDSGSHGSAPVYTSSIEARQHTPKQLKAAAEKNKFSFVSFYGVHPHLLMAGMNRKMPPHVFNHLSKSLEALESHPASLIWSSVFIGVFKKSL